MGPLSRLPFPRWSGRRLGLRREEAPRHWLLGLGLGARERWCAELDSVRPHPPASCQPGHNKSGPRSRWPLCRRLAQSAGRAGWGVGVGWRTLAGLEADQAGKGLSRGGPGRGQGTPASLAGLPMGLLFASWLGVFLKVTPEGCRLPGWRRPGGKETRWGVGWQGEVSAQDAAERVI